MLQKEIIYREILYQALEKKVFTFTQLSLSKQFNYSLSTIHGALQPPQQMGAIQIKLRSFEIIDPMKLLYYWASLRNLQKEIIYQIRINLPVKEIEKSLPDSTIYGAFSSYKFKFKDVPADYSEVYVYGNVEEIKKRFPEPNEKLPPNLFILEKDAFLGKYGKITTLAQTYADLWNIKEWYARDFLDALKKKIEEVIQNGK